MPITDLTGYTWTANSSVSLSSWVFQDFFIDFISNSIGFDSMQNREEFLAYYNPDVMQTIVYDGSWLLQAYRTIEITGGNDSTNPNLITWLEANGTLTAPAPQPSASISIGNLSLAKSFIGNTEVSKIFLGDIKLYEKQTPSGFEVELYGWDGAGETVYVQINDDPTWYYAEMIPILGFATDHTNIPNVYEKIVGQSIGIPNVSKIKIGTAGNPTQYTGPQYVAGSSTGDFVGLTFTSTGGSAPAYATGEITMTQDSKVYFHGDD